MGKKKEECLNLGYPIFETHCHLDYLKRFPLEDLLDKCKQSNVQKILTIGVSPDHQDEIISIADQFDHIYCSQGVHPHKAAEFTSEVEKKLKENINHPKVLALGEIGLDYHYNYAPREVQIATFEKQLEIAIENQRPTIIHTREADEDTLAILKNAQGKISSLVLHSYTSGLELAQYAVSQGYFIGFNGILTFKNAQNVRDTLKEIPIENIVIETDAPFLSPTPHRGIENGPHLLPFIVQRIAEEKEIELDQLMPQLWKNSHQLFNATL